MTDRSLIENDNIECPLCLGQGQLTRSEVLERLGMKDFARVAQLSAEEALRLLLKEHKEEESSLWLRFEAELTKRLNDVTSKHKNELQALQNEKSSLALTLADVKKNQENLLKNTKAAERLDAEKQLQDQIISLNGRISGLAAKTELFEQQKAVELQKLKTEFQGQVTAKQSENSDLARTATDHLREISDLRTRNQALEMEMSKVARVGRKEEIGFAEEAESWPGIWLSEKLKKYGDYILAYRDLSGEPQDPRMVIDNKDKTSVTEDDVEKLIRDAKEQGCPVAVLLAKDETQLRTLDKDGRWASKDGVWILRTTRQWFRRDLDILKPLFETMRAEGPDFITKNSQLADEIRRTFEDIDQMEKELKKAAKAIECAKELASAYRDRLQQLCEATVPKKFVTRTTLTPDIRSLANEEIVRDRE
jgi:hypothetical protein